MSMVMDELGEREETTGLEQTRGVYGVVAGGTGRMLLSMAVGAILGGLVGVRIGMAKGESIGLLRGIERGRREALTSTSAPPPRLWRRWWRRAA